MKDNLPVFNIADLNNKVQLMEIAIETLSRTPCMGIVVAHLIGTFIDSLADTSKMTFNSYFEKYFPDLNKAIGANNFYTHIRNKAIHEFAVKPPLALAHSQQFDNGNAYIEVKMINGQNWTFLNVDRLTNDFLEHLKTIKK